MFGCLARTGNTQIILNDMAKKKKQTEFLAGDKVKLERKSSKKEEPLRIGSPEKPATFPVAFEGASAQIVFNKVYEVSGKTDFSVVDNQAKPLPLIAKDFINNPVYHSLFTKVKSSTNDNEE